jgi:hypothetical protein
MFVVASCMAVCSEPSIPIAMRNSALSRRGARGFAPGITSTVNSTSSDVSSALPAISPSPWAA